MCCIDGDPLEALNRTIPGFGTEIDGHDEVGGIGVFTPYYSGTAYWDIPWRYIVKNTTNAYEFKTLRQEKTIDQWGNMTISKGGHLESSNLLDPTSGW